MTEYQYQLARKVMQRANYLRGIITTKKGVVAKWVAMEADAKEKMQPTKVEGFKKLTLKAIEALDKAKKDFKDLKLPEEMNAPKIYRCEECGTRVKDGNSFCEEHSYLETV